MTITTDPVRNQYTAAQDQTVFNYTFKIYTNQDLNVYLTPAGQDPDDNNDLITTYTVDPGTIGDENGGFITLDVGANVNDTLTIVSNIPYDRETDYQVNGDFSPTTVNNDIDRSVSLIKQNLGLIDRAVLSPESGSGQGVTIPSPQEGQGLKWESDTLVNTPIVETVTTNTTNQTLINISGNNVVTRGLKGSQNVSFSDDGTDITIFAQVQGGAGDVGSATDNQFTGTNSFQSDIGVWQYQVDNVEKTVGNLQPTDGSVTIEVFPDTAGGKWVEVEYVGYFNNLSGGTALQGRSQFGFSVAPADESKGYVEISAELLDETTKEVTRLFTDKEAGNRAGDPQSNVTAIYDSGALTSFVGQKLTVKSKMLFFVENVSAPATTISFDINPFAIGNTNTATQTGLFVKYRIITDPNVTTI